MKSRSGSLNKPRCRVIALGLALALCASSPSAGADSANSKKGEFNPASFEELLEAFAGMPGLEARFEEEKFIAILAAPLRSKGRLYFAPPSTLLRRVESPRRQEILIHAGQVRISTRSNEVDGEPPVVQMIDLSTHEGIRPLVESMIWIFTGNRAALEEVYSVDYQRSTRGDGGGEDSKGWEVRLTPRSAALSALIRELRVRGRGLLADTLELVESSGDRTVTVLLDANPLREFSPVERLELFGAADR